MDKQQALKSWMEKTFPKGCNKVSVLKGRRSFEAGWEAREDLLSPTDAVMFARFLLNERYVYYSDSTAINIQDLYKLFNPSGAAPQYGDKNCEHCDGDGYISVKEAGGDTVTQMYCPHCEARNEAMLETLETSTAPPAAGPVWVKASERLPDNPGSPQNHWRLDGFHKVNGNFYEDGDEIVFGVIGNGCHEDYIIRKDKFDRIEFLNDRPARQVFTREQVDKISNAAMSRFKAYIPELTFQEWFDDYMNTNYPLQNK